MLDRKRIEKGFVRQHDMTDCGAACLLSLIRYYGGDSSILHLREISGTSNTGTTLLGLYQAAGAMGFDAQGVEANGISDLIEHGKPCVLAVVIDKTLSHFVVCYGYENGHFIMCDPGKGVIEMTESELEEIWTRKCLLLEPNGSFVKKESVREKKKAWMLDLVKEDYGILGAGVAIGLAIAVLGMVMSVFSQKLVDEVLPSHNTQKLVAGLILVLVLLLAKVVISALRGKLLITQSRNFNNRIIRFFFWKLLHLPKSFFDTRKTGDMVARLGDTRRIQSVIGTLAGETIINVLILVVAIVFLFVYSWRIALASLACMPVFYWIVSRNNKKVISKQRDVMVSYAMSESGFINTIGGIPDIKSFSVQDSFLKLNELLYGNFQTKVFDLGQTQIGIGLWAGISSTMIQMGLIGLCSVFVFSGAMTTGELMAVIGITGTLFPAVASLALIMIPINEAKVAFDRMYEVVEAGEEETLVDEVELPVHTLEVKDLAFRFVGRKRLFSNLSLKFETGTITSIVGESGCGKSTLCQVLERFYLPEEGLMTLDGVVADEIPLAQWRSLVSFVPQQTYLYNGTVLENISFGTPVKNPEEILSFCRKYGFDAFIGELPNGLGTLVGEEGINLSGGQAQLVSFARALYKPSKILILDEMSSAMDRRTERHICKLLQQLRKDHIIILVTHRLETARTLSDNIIVMEGGVIRAQGPHEVLMKTENFYSEYWHSLQA